MILQSYITYKEQANSLNWYPPPVYFWTQDIALDTKKKHFWEIQYYQLSTRNNGKRINKNSSTPGSKTRARAGACKRKCWYIWKRIMQYVMRNAWWVEKIRHVPSSAILKNTTIWQRDKMTLPQHDNMKLVKLTTLQSDNATIQ